VVESWALESYIWAMDWGLVLLGGCFGALWLLLGAVFRFIEVRSHLRIWGPGPYGAHRSDHDSDYARTRK
jgi:hypothetical protein